MVADLYSSRISKEAKMIRRQDDVIHKNSELFQGPLSAEDLKTYERNGYLLFKDLFSKEDIQVLKEELRHVMELNKNNNSEDVIREPGSNEVRSIFEIHKNSEFFERLSKNKKLVSIAQQLLGSQVYITQSRINFKPGFKGKEFYWHSDFETWHVEDGMPNMRAVSCSIVLTDNHEFNGPLMLIPGSHKWYVSCSGETPENNYKQSLQKQELGVPDENSLKTLVDQAGGRIDRATGPAGSVLFFDSNIMHASSGNISPFSRSNVFFVFNSIENQLTNPFSDANPRPEFLANRKNIQPIKPLDESIISVPSLVESK
ncbi:ectoine hydroxylase [Halalkalibacter nanhaiisediminis]|uniref:Ectoine hydroxylase n=1 Tax=Halalkalibacter nanhaiisediminis TaxID=688079 RepID=A0A562QR24_9BACI|nr:ectoine hydroxylase [Halalkalibacter nanhaiisediminis]TWI59123.1 ectoine hydroxylase [Halalkalibacter nanhaiisediminis]